MSDVKINSSTRTESHSNLQNTEGKNVSNIPLSQKSINSNQKLTTESYSESETIASHEESHNDNNNPHTESIIDPSMVLTNYDQNIDDHLPETVTLLKTPCGSKLYLIGTLHFSIESQNDVAQIIQAVQPNKVIVELCKARLHVLLYDENDLLEEVKNLNFQTIRDSIQKNGLFNGLMYVLMLNLSVRLTKALGMAPGGEFRRAFVEAKNVPNCMVCLGDRPINITVQRALRSLSWWQTIKLGWNCITASTNFTTEEIEQCKRRDILEQLMAEMAGEFPMFEEVFVKERDIFLTNALQLACEPEHTLHGSIPVRVVGVVGIGHVSGIVQHWGKVKKSQIPPIMSIPPRSLASKIIQLSVKTFFFGAVIYVGYKIIPLPSFLSPQSVKSSVMGLVKVSNK